MVIVFFIFGIICDIVEIVFNVGGYLVLLSDMVGLWEIEDFIEKEGVYRVL